MNVRRWKRALAVIAGVVVLLAAVFLVYLKTGGYRAVDVDAFMASDASVTVEEIPEGWFFDGSGTEEALIFYPGAKVEPTAYSPLLHQLAEAGIDYFLMKMPFDMAIFDVDRADDILAKYEYETWDLAGHSMGGAMAAYYMEENAEAFDKLIFLAAYTTKDLTGTDLAVLSLYGEYDEVVNRKLLEEGRALVPQNYTEIEIPGGNHAGFGSYGPQKGDGTATIPAEEQWAYTVERILAM